MGEFLELIFGLVILAFFLFMIIGIPMSILADSKKPKTRRRKPQYRQPYYSSDFKPKEFDYYHKSEPGEFFVYFIANERLGALKIGVGNTGRISQLLDSYTQKDESSENIGWEILKVAQFSDSQTNYEAGKQNGNEAERRAHYYWRYVLKLPLYLSEEQMGFSRIIKNGRAMWVATPGYTETANLNKVCEVSTWNYVKNSPGFIRETNSFSGVNPRKLRLLNEAHSKLVVPAEYENFKLVQINHFSPKATEPRPSNQAHTTVLRKRAGKDAATSSTSGSKTPKPYTAGGIGIYSCVTPGCIWPSSSMFESTKCEKCKQKN